MTRTNNRRGLSMIEMLVSISVTGVLLVIIAGWVHETLNCASLIKQRQRHHQNLTRLSGSLRDHVHECKSMAMDGAERLVLSRGDGTQATYTIAGNILHFEKRASQANGDPSVLMRDKFVLSPNSIVSWEMSEMPNWISLVVTRTREFGRPSPTVDPMPVDLHVRVAPNRWGPSLASSAATDNKNARSK